MKEAFLPSSAGQREGRDDASQSFEDAALPPSFLTLSLPMGRIVIDWPTTPMPLHLTHSPLHSSPASFPPSSFPLDEASGDPDAQRVGFNALGVGQAEQPGGGGRLHRASLQQDRAADRAVGGGG